MAEHLFAELCCSRICSRCWNGETSERRVVAYLPRTWLEEATLRDCANSTFPPDLFDPFESSDDDYAIPPKAVRMADTIEAPGASSRSAAHKPIPFGASRSLSPDMANGPCYARLKFPDGIFDLPTISCVLGLAPDTARGDSGEGRQTQESGQGEESQRLASVDGPTTRSSFEEIPGFWSNSGAVVGSDGPDVAPSPTSSRKREKRPNLSFSSPSSPVHESVDGFATTEDTFASQSGNGSLPPSLFSNERQQAQHHATNNSLLSFPDECPMVPLYPPKREDGIVPKNGGISKRHAKIYYDFGSGNWKMDIMGRNGAFLDEVPYGPGDIVKLYHGCAIQIGPIVFNFYLPNESQHDSWTAEDPDESNGMSFSFEDGRGESIALDSSDYESDPPEFSFGHAYDYDDALSYPDENELSNEGDNAEESNINEEDFDEEADESDNHGKTRPAQNGRAKEKPIKLKVRLNTRPTPKKGKNKKIEATSIKHQATAKTSSKSPKKPQRKEKVVDQSKESKTKPKDQSKAHLKEDVNVANETETKSKSDRKAKGGSKDSTNENAQAGPWINGVDITVEGVPLFTPILPRRKGPGRPPKDGFLSRREKNLLNKQEKERLKAEKLGLDPSQLPQPAPRTTSTSKVTKPKKDENGGPVDSVNGASISKSPDAGEKPSKVSRPARSPSPEMRREDYTEEQLAKPGLNHATMIYEVLSTCKTGSMSLQQIYSAVEHRWPYYRFDSPTKGWQSSIRHNVKNPAFRKVERDGKGWSWAIIPGVPIEREKKGRVSPPSETPRQPYYPQQQMPYNHPQGLYPSLPPNGVHPGMPAYSQPPATYAPPQRLPPSLNGVPPALMTPLGASNYSSPYASPYARAPANPPLSASNVQQASHPNPQHRAPFYHPQHPGQQPTRPAGTPASYPQPPPRNTTTPPGAPPHAPHQHPQPPPQPQPQPQPQPSRAPPQPRQDIPYWHTYLPPGLSQREIEALTAFRTRHITSDPYKVPAETRINNALCKAFKPNHPWKDQSSGPSPEYLQLVAAVQAVAAEARKAAGFGGANGGGVVVNGAWSVNGAGHVPLGAAGSRPTSAASAGAPGLAGAGVKRAAGEMGGEEGMAGGDAGRGEKRMKL